MTPSIKKTCAATRVTARAPHVSGAEPNCNGVWMGKLDIYVKSANNHLHATLPDFTADGVLPPGDYVLTIDELLESSLVYGHPDRDRWNIAWRRKLVENLRIMVGHLTAVDVADIFIDGSFVEE